MWVEQCEGEVLKFSERLATDDRSAPVIGELVLAFVDRCKSRLRTRLSDGRDAGLMLPRGTVLRGGDRLRADAGEVVLVQAAVESLYEVRAVHGATRPELDLRRAAYHLGNRHIAVELANDTLKLERDPVLRDMLLGLGVQVREIEDRFEPESGAYGGGHRHDHDADGGSMGERLSQEAHGVFQRERSTAPVFAPAPYR